ncbi:LuxR family transcriptional regulator, partial [Microbacterium sp. SUBG005]
MEHIVYVVDDDDTVRQSVVRLLESADIHALGFFLSRGLSQPSPFEDLPSCVILDMQ